MPLPPLAENNTVRGWLKYSNMGVEHELQFRLPAGSSSADVGLTGQDLATGLKSLLPDTDSFKGLRWAIAGSNLSFPLPFAAIAGTGGAASGELDDKAKFIALAGRSLNGYRCRITLFTAATPDTQGYRGPTGTLYNVVTALSMPLVAIDGAPVVWNAYSNVGYNAYWQRQLRG